VQLFFHTARPGLGLARPNGTAEERGGASGGAAVEWVA
jgi:hypothetical protein